MRPTSSKHLAATPSGVRSPGDPRPRLRHRGDGPLACAAAARTAALGRCTTGTPTCWRSPPPTSQARPPTGPRSPSRRRQSDITRLDPGDLAGATLITASALLDLLTGDELAGLVAVCAGAGCPVLLTLSVVGRVELTPADPLDARVAAAFDAHQRRTTERGRLLGPDAVAVAVAEFGRLGADVLVRPSPWRLGAVEADLAAEWFTGWVAAACEQEVELAAETDAYARRRLAEATAGAARRHRGPRRPAGPAPSRSGAPA